jgi:hypothetical protein
MATEKRSHAEHEEQAAKNRKRLALAAAAALLLLRKKRNSIVDTALAAGFPIPFIAHHLAKSLVVPIAESRAYARQAGLKRLEAEAVSADLGSIVRFAERRAFLHAEVARDLARSRKAADHYAKRWAAKAASAEGETKAEIVKVANAETQGALKRIAVTESADSFNSSRLDEARATGLDLYRRWDARSDSCPECGDLDGTIVAIDDEFPGGAEPGSIHGSCQCSWELLTAEEAGESPRFNSDEAA